MKWLYSLAEFGVTSAVASSPPSYWYTGRCPQTGIEQKLPRTALAEAIARGLMAQLAADPVHHQEGKMYGVLLVETPTGNLGVLKGFSGLLGGQSDVPGWVPPIPGRAQVALAETRTLKQLEHIQSDLIALQQLSAREEYARLSQVFGDRLNELSVVHQARKQERDRLRQRYQAELEGEERAIALAKLNTQSQRDGIERRRLKEERDEVLHPLEAAITRADQRIQALKRRRKALSCQLQAQMHAVYSLTNFAGMTKTLQDLVPSGLPTGTGDCAAPKLLHYAATHRLRPVALAEFWYGAPQEDKRPGHFYGACAERCQPIMGFLLSGLPTPPLSAIGMEVEIPILYRDETLIVVEKPSGLLSVPGRTQNLQDSVVSRLRCQYELSFLKAVHRLDKGTSGVFAMATTPEVHSLLSQQFAQRLVKKSYEAILSRPIDDTAGRIELPLWRDPRDRPKQSVNFERGKPSRTDFQVLESSDRPRVRFVPYTGRTHQLRVHAAHPKGLDAPILGDTLYGDRTGDQRLHLHATSLKFVHPISRKPLQFSSPALFS